MKDRNPRSPVPCSIPFFVSFCYKLAYFVFWIEKQGIPARFYPYPSKRRRISPVPVGHFDWSVLRKEGESPLKVNMTVEVWQKEARYLARCPELDFVAQGKDAEEAKRNLLEVMEIQFEEMSELGTLEDYLQECGYTLKDNIAISLSELVAFEKSAVLVLE